MRFLSIKGLKEKFADAESIVQVRILTKMRSVIEVEGPVSEEDAAAILKLAMVGIPKGNERADVQFEESDNG